MKALRLSDLLIVAEQVGAPVSKVPGYVVVERGGRAVRFGDQKVVTRIDCVAFEPPYTVPGFRRLGREYGRVLAAVETRLPVRYVHELARLLLVGLPSLPTVVEPFARERAPVLPCDASTATVMHSLLASELQRERVNADRRETRDLEEHGRVRLGRVRS